MENLDLSCDQSNARDAILSWYKDRKTYLFRMGGYAGTGKTTLLAQVRRDLLGVGARKVAFVCYTGKASQVLRRKLHDANVIMNDDFCGTIHSLIYIPIVNKITGEITGWDLKDFDDIHYDLIAIDEASMVDENIYDDLQHYKIPMLAIGDPFQVPPIEGSFNLMENSDIVLTEIHRQEADNPIIRLSLMLRNCEPIPYGNYGDCVAKVPARESQVVSSFVTNTKSFKNTMIICGFNKTRCEINQSIRKTFGFFGEYASVGERVICLKNNRNAVDVPIANGMLGTLAWIEEHPNRLALGIKFDGEDSLYVGSAAKDTWGDPKPKLINKTIVVSKKKLNQCNVRDITATDDNCDNRIVLNIEEDNEVFFEEQIDFFDFGYCLTVHKSQGSQAQRVMLIEQPCQYWSGEMWFRWLYTGITRAEKQLLIVG